MIRSMKKMDVQYKKANDVCRIFLSNDGGVDEGIVIFLLYEFTRKRRGRRRRRGDRCR
jgi:hypothetical protein